MKLVSAPRFENLRASLIHGGLSPRQVRFTVLELQDHFADLEAEAIDAGRSPSDAVAEAALRLGDEDAIAKEILSRPELRPWTYRWPLAQRVAAYTLTLALLPVLPFVVCVENGEPIARWGTAICLSAGITSGLLLILHVMISA